MKHFILMMFLIIGASDLKAETTFFAHTVSYHEDREQGYNEENYGIGFRHYVDPGRYLIAGIYENSEYNRSSYAGYGWEFGRGDLKLELSAGLITGYSTGDVLPYVLPTVKYKNVGLTFILYSKPVVHLTIDLMEF